MSERVDGEGFSDLPAWKAVPMAIGVVILMLLVVVVTNRASDVTSGVLPDSLNYSLIGLAVTYVGLEAYARVVTGRSLRWFAFDDPDRSTLGWTAFGLALPVVVTVVHVFVQNGEVAGRITDPSTVLVSLLGSVGVGLFTAALEEFTFRGIAYRLLEDRWNAAVAILAPALLFSVLHTGRADTRTELWLVVARTVVGGVLFGLIVYRTRNVWNAVAVHAGWNFLLGARVVRVAAPGSTPDPAILGLSLTEVGPFGTAVSMTNTPVTIALLVVACAVLAFRMDERVGRRRWGSIR